VQLSVSCTKQFHGIIKYSTAHKSIPASFILVMLLFLLKVYGLELPKYENLDSSPYLCKINYTAKF